MAGKAKRSTTKKNTNFYLSLLVKLLTVIVLFSVSRLVFYLANFHYFSMVPAGEIMKIFLAGIRFDISAVLILNLPFIFFNTIPFRFRESPVPQMILNGYFYVINSFGLMLNFIDMIYFRFTLKRTTADIFKYLGVGGDFDKLVPQFLKDFWFVALIWIISVLLLILISRKYRYHPEQKKNKSKPNGSYLITAIIIFIIAMFISVIGIRGGFQLRPITIVTAGNYTSAKNVPLLLNTPFTIAKTWNDKPLKEVSYYSKESELEKIYSPVHHGDTSGFRKLNVMIIIMESFSAEHFGALNKDVDNGRYPGFTPFLDSLIGHSYCVKAYANSKTSIQGIPAILSGIPSLMNESYIQSPYSANNIKGLASALREKGYTTAFFHGGTNGTMGFDSWTKIAGYDHYFGRSEYGNEKDYDGKWGIRDEEFFQYTAETMNNIKQPFLVSFFSLSSHHPYTVPEKYKNVLRKGKLPIQQAVMYSDLALRRFFEKASSSSWYDSTLFVITADHTSEGYLPWYQTAAGQFSIPIIFFMPERKIQGPNDLIAQQTDIMPTVLSMLHYDKDYIAYGNNIFDSSAEHFSVNFTSGIYNLIKDGYLLQFDGSRTIAMFDLKKDNMQKTNIADRQPAVRQRLETFLKAYIQQYNNRLIENRLTAD